jgi:hypothetical protein
MSPQNTAYLCNGYRRVDPFTKQNIKERKEKAIQYYLFKDPPGPGKQASLFWFFVLQEIKDFNL